ncbi:MAG: xylulokinase [Cyclobacteriaceae bacterium]
MADSHYLLGLDIGSSSIKASLLDAENGHLVGSATSPSTEMPMQAPEPGWAEQHPEMWWDHVVTSVQEIITRYKIVPAEIGAIGISYQMHGLVCVDKDQRVLRPGIIWCDSRAVEIGNEAFSLLGSEFCLSRLLNSPGNFTASKLRWVQQFEPEIYSKIYKIMLPGDYIAMRLTGEINTTESGLSEGIFFDFQKQSISSELLEHYGIDKNLIPDIVPTFAVQGELTKEAAEILGLKAGTKVAYRAGDQPNNAFSLNVMEPGEVAATAGTSGVVYGIIDKPSYDQQSRVNTFVHVNHQHNKPRYGVLLCVNGTGILNSWLKHNVAGPLDYNGMNQEAAEIAIGSDGVMVLPFGNGAERVLGNKDVGARFINFNFNRHTRSHLFRASQEGIVFALNYGFQIMQQMGLKLNVVRAGQANMFLSNIFKQTFANATGATVQLINTDGAQGAARGAGLGAGIYKNRQDAFRGLKTIEEIVPEQGQQDIYQNLYEKWQQQLNSILKS